MKLLYGFIISIIAQALSFIQFQGQLAWKFPKDHPFIMSLLGIPISYFLIQTVKIFNEHFETNWPGRLIGFGIGIIVFTVMSWIVFDELPTLKTWICLILASIIVGVQIFWK